MCAARRAGLCRQRPHRRAARGERIRHPHRPSLRGCGRARLRVFAPSRPPYALFPRGSPAVCGAPSPFRPRARGAARPLLGSGAGQFCGHTFRLLRARPHAVLCLRLPHAPRAVSRGRARALSLSRRGRVRRGVPHGVLGAVRAGRFRGRERGGRSLRLLPSAVRGGRIFPPPPRILRFFLFFRKKNRPPAGEGGCRS